MATVELLSKIKGHEAGRHFWAGVSPFVKLAYTRSAREMEEGARNLISPGGSGTRPV
jgi:hypothetical protein